jgi:hypothetical protein
MTTLSVFKLLNMPSFLMLILLKILELLIPFILSKVLVVINATLVILIHSVAMDVSTLHIRYLIFILLLTKNVINLALLALTMLVNFVYLAIQSVHLVQTKLLIVAQNAHKIIKKINMMYVSQHAERICTYQTANVKVVIIIVKDVLAKILVIIVNKELF